MSDALKVVWSHGVKLTDLILNQENRNRPEYLSHGVYVHLHISHAGERRLRYVGRALGAPSLWQRQLEHYLNLIGGRYQIPSMHPGEDAWEMCTSTKCDEASLSRTINTIGDCKKFMEIVRRGFAYAGSSTVYLGAFDKSANSADIKQAERELIFGLEPEENRTGKNTPPSQGPRSFAHEFREGLSWGDNHLYEKLRERFPNHQLA